MSKTNVTETVRSLTEPIIESLNLELVDIEFVKEGVNWYLRIFIDKEGGVDLDDCQTASGLISDKLDEKDPIEQAYFLEVSSPGIERPIKNDNDLTKNIGLPIQIQSYAPIAGEKTFVGVLKEFNEAGIKIEMRKKLITIPRDKVSHIKTVWQP